MKLENLERVKELDSDLAKRQEFLNVAKDKDFALKSMTFKYEGCGYNLNNTVRNLRLLTKLHDLYILELEREIAELKAELETL